MKILIRITVISMSFLLGFWGVLFAQDASNCSTIQRWTTPSQTFEQMYSLDNDKKTYLEKAGINVTNVLAKTAIGSDARYDNSEWQCDNGDFIGEELSQWNSFWSKYAAVAGVSFAYPLSRDEVKKMQTYINEHCGLNIATDGKIGKKTINAVQVCVSPCKWYCTWSWFNSNKNKIYTDTAGTKKLVENGLYTQNPSIQSYLKESEIASPLTKDTLSDWWFGLVEAPVTPSPSSVSTPCARFKVPEGIKQTNFDTSLQKYLSTKKLQQWQTNSSDTTSCTCAPWSQEKTYRFEGQGIPYCEVCDAEKCNCGTKLNTSIPFIGRCIMYKKTNNTNQWWTDTVSINALNAFPVLMGSLMKILMSLILLVAFGSLIVAGVMMTVPDQYESGKKLIWKVVYAIALLWLSGTILYLINPNFFK